MSYIFQSGFQEGRRRSARLTLMTEKLKNPLEMDTNWDVKDQVIISL